MKKYYLHHICIFILRIICLIVFSCIIAWFFLTILDTLTVISQSKLILSLSHWLIPKKSWFPIDITWTLAMSFSVVAELLFPGNDPISLSCFCGYSKICTHISRIGGRSLQWDRVCNSSPSGSRLSHSTWSFLFLCIYWKKKFMISMFFTT